MRKIMIVAVAAALAALTTAPARAATIVQCIGDAGRQQNGEWTFQPHEVQIPGAFGLTADCTFISSDESVGEFGCLLADVPGFVCFPQVTLSATGDFACGNGTLSSDPNAANDIANISTNIITMTWTSTLSNGIGTVTGTSTRGSLAQTINGILAVNDGAATGSCDDSVGSGNAVLFLTFS